MSVRTNASHGNSEARSAERFSLHAHSCFCASVVSPDACCCLRLMWRAPLAAPTPARAGRCRVVPPWFEEVAAARGITWVHRSGHGDAISSAGDHGRRRGALRHGRRRRSRPLPGPERQRARSGKKDPPNRLYRNRGDGTFEDATAGSGTDVGGYGMGVASGDYDNDGDTDLFVTNAGPNVLLRNDGQRPLHRRDGRRRRRRQGLEHERRVLSITTPTATSISSCCATSTGRAATELQCFSLMGAPDYCSPRNYDAPLSEHALSQQRRRHVHRRLAGAPGCMPRSATGSASWSSDFNRDGRPDLFVANDAMPNQLWINQGQGRFEDARSCCGTAVDEDGTAKSGMGVDAKDVDDDGDEDLLVVNLDGESDSFFRNDGKFFSDATAAAGLRVGEPAVHALRHRVDRFRQRRLARSLSSQRARRAAGRALRRRSVRRAEPALQGLERRTIRRGPAARRHGTAADRLEPGRGIRRSRQRRRRRHRRRQSRPRARICCATSRRHAATGWRFACSNQTAATVLAREVTLSVGDRTITRTVRAAYSYLASNDPRVHVGLGARDEGRQRARALAEWCRRRRSGTSQPIRSSLSSGREARRWRLTTGGHESRRDT